MSYLVQRIVSYINKYLYYDFLYEEIKQNETTENIICPAVTSKPITIIIKSRQVTGCQFHSKNVQKTLKQKIAKTFAGSFFYSFFIWKTPEICSVGVLLGSFVWTRVGWWDMTKLFCFYNFWFYLNFFCVSILIPDLNKLINVN